MNRRTLGLVFLAITAGAMPALAHHSHANYWETEWINLEGTVQQIHWVNPHTWIYLDVTEGTDNTGAWALEGASVTTLRRDGWSQDSIKAGDTISVRCHPLKDGSRGCLMGFVVMVDGSEKEFD
jgi:hypothetical protein